MRSLLFTLITGFACLTLPGCATTNGSAEEGAPSVEASQGGATAEAPAEDIPDSFSWVDQGKMAGLSDPRTGGPGEGQDYDWTLSWLKDNGVDVLISLTTTPPPSSNIENAGLHHIHIPVHDFKAPKVSQLQSFLTLASSRIASGEGIAVHCTAGIGRTGTFLAAYLVGQGMSADEAIAKVRKERPGSVETGEQEQVVRDLEAAIR